MCRTLRLWCGGGREWGCACVKLNSQIFRYIVPNASRSFRHYKFAKGASGSGVGGGEDI